MVSSSPSWPPGRDRIGHSGDQNDTSNDNQQFFHPEILLSKIIVFCSLLSKGCAKQGNGWVTG
jgi:hypothetical protein